jgi:hypothetical protein
MLPHIFKNIHVYTIAFFKLEYVGNIKIILGHITCKLRISAHSRRIENTRYTERGQIKIVSIKNYIAIKD